jgi:hypothetical protein
MIRQAISCDICGADKKQTKDWLIAEERAGELRIGRWSADARPRPATRHLCGQTCLHKMVDEFLARGNAAARHVPVATEVADRSERVVTDASLSAEIADFESEARLLTPAVPAKLPIPAAAVVIPLQVRGTIETMRPVRIDETRTNTPRRLRAEAWQREREREQRAERDSHRRTN